MQISIGSSTGRDFTRDGISVGCNVGIVGFDLSLEIFVGCDAGRRFGREGGRIGENFSGVGRVEGVDGIHSSRRALAFESCHAGIEGGIGHTVGTDHTGEEGVVGETGLRLGIDVVLERYVACSAG